MIKYEDFTILPFSLCCFPRSFASRPWAKPLASWPRWPRAVRRRSWRSLRRPPFFDVLGSFFCYIYIYIYVSYIYISYVHVYIICIYVHSSLYVYMYILLFITFLKSLATLRKPDIDNS